MDDLLKVDGFDEAIMGTAGRCAMTNVLVYDENKIISILQERHGMDEDDAREYYEFNIKGAYMGEMTPLFFDPTIDLE